MTRPRLSRACVAVISKAIRQTSARGRTGPIREGRPVAPTFQQCPSNFALLRRCNFPLNTCEIAPVRPSVGQAVFGTKTLIHCLRVLGPGVGQPRTLNLCFWQHKAQTSTSRVQSRVFLRLLLQIHHNLAHSPLHKRSGSKEQHLHFTEQRTKHLGRLSHNEPQIYASRSQ